MNDHALPSSFSVDLRCEGESVPIFQFVETSNAGLNYEIGVMTKLLVGLLHEPVTS